MILGEIPSAITNINSSGEPIEQGNTTWILAEYGNTQGWVDSKYLAIQKGEVPEELVSFGWQVLDALKKIRLQSACEFGSSRSLLEILSLLLSC